MPQSAPGMNAFYGSRSAAGDRSSTLAKVMGLLALASVFTAAGAVAGLPLGRAGFFIGLIGAIVCLIVLGFVKDRTPLNLILLYTFSVLEGVFLGQVLDSYISAGLSRVVLVAGRRRLRLPHKTGPHGTRKRPLHRSAGRHRGVHRGDLPAPARPLHRDLGGRRTALHGVPDLRSEPDRARRWGRHGR